MYHSETKFFECVYFGQFFMHILTIIFYYDIIKYQIFSNLK